MDSASETLLRLADPAARAAVLDPATLLALATVCYDLDPAQVGEPVTADYARFDLAVAAEPVTASARIMRSGDPVPWEVAACWDGPTGAVADAVWSGSVVVRVTRSDDTVVGLDTTAVDLDAAFAAAVAGLPATATPAQVRAALRDAARSELAAPPLTDTELDAVLRQMAPDAADPRALGHAARGRSTITTRLRVRPPGQDAPAVPVPLPVVVAFLAAGRGAAPRDLLRATAAARRAAAPYPLAAAPAGAPPRRVERCVCWLLPAAAFDDPGWPGGGTGTAAEQRAVRLAAARGWLAAHGIAVATAGEQA